MIWKARDKIDSVLVGNVLTTIDENNEIIANGTNVILNFNTEYLLSCKKWSIFKGWIVKTCECCTEDIEVMGDDWDSDEEIHDPIEHVKYLVDMPSIWAHYEYTKSCLTSAAHIA